MPDEHDGKLRLNYYVGAMLAQGGEVSLEDSKIVFSPTSALDRAMGATDIEIPLNEIRGLHQKSYSNRVFHVKTENKDFKFEGSQAQKLSDLLEKALRTKGLIAAVEIERKSNEPTSNENVRPAPIVICGACKRTLNENFAFCPYCGTAMKSGCPSCNKPVEKDWLACAFCGHNLK